VRGPARRPHFSLAIISLTVQLWTWVFWVISVYFNIRNTLPKSGTFLLGHPVYGSHANWSRIPKDPPKHTLRITGLEYSDLFKSKVKVKWSRYRPGVAQGVGTGIALLFHDRGTRRGWVVSSSPRPHFTPGKDPVPILQEAGWAPGPVWTGGGESRPHPDSIPDRPARSQSLYRLSYPAHLFKSISLICFAMV